MTLHPTDRRTVLRTAAWATPAVLAASAAPAFATSGATVLTVDPGSTSLQSLALIGSDTYWGPRFSGFTITTTQALAANELTVTLWATSPRTQAFVYQWAGQYTDDPTPWVTTGRHAVPLNAIVLRYPAPVPAGTPVPLHGALALVTNSGYLPVTDSTVSVSAPGMPRVVLTFDHPTSAPGAMAAPTTPTTPPSLAGHRLRAATD